MTEAKLSAQQSGHLSSTFSRIQRHLRHFACRQVAPLPLVFVLCTVIIIARNPDSVFRAEFWAEDATEFFFGALSLGIRSLVTPVYGYQFFLSRFVAYLATFVPVLWTPYIYALSALIIDAFVTSYFAKDSFSWIIPSRWCRSAVCALLAVGPGTREVFFNLTNLAYVLTFFGLLLLVEKPFRLSIRKFVVLIGLTLCAGPMSLLAPLVALLWLLSRDRMYLFLLVCFIPVIVMNSIGTHYVAGDAELLAYANIRLVPTILIEQSYIRLFLMPLLGHHITGVVMQTGVIFWLGSLIVAGACLFYLYVDARRRSWEQPAILLVAYLCTIGSFGLIAISRNYAIGEIVRQSGESLWEMRYSYLPGMVSLIIWFAVLFHLLGDRGEHEESTTVLFTRHRGVTLKALVAYAGMLVVAFHNVSRWGMPPFYGSQPNVHWPQAAAALQEVLDKKKEGTLREPVVVENITWVHPVGWVPSRGKLMLIITPD